MQDFKRSKLAAVQPSPTRLSDAGFDVMEVPGIGTVRTLDQRTFEAALKAAGRRLKVAIESVRKWEPQ